MKSTLTIIFLIIGSSLGVATDSVSVENEKDQENRVDQKDDPQKEKVRPSEETARNKDRDCHKSAIRAALSKGSTIEVKWQLINGMNACIPCLASGWYRCDNVAPHIDYINLMENFVSLPKTETVSYLLKKLKSIKRTDIHICPFDSAIEGELAVYFLQIITGLEWSKYKGKNKIINRAIATLKKYREENSYDINLTEQDLLRRVLRNKTSRRALSTYFKRKTYNKKLQGTENPPASQADSGP